MEICYDKMKREMSISQTDFIEKVAKRFDVTNTKDVNIKTPIKKNLSLLPAETVDVKLPYRQLVGCLLYVSICTRPDILYAINYLSRFMNSYSDLHFRYLKRVLVYLYHTQKMKLVYLFSNEKKVLECYANAQIS